MPGPFVPLAGLVVHRDHAAAGAAEGQDAVAVLGQLGDVRTEVGRQTGVRHTPSLTFIADALPDNARQIDDLLARAAESDAAVAAARLGAQYAGEPDPYRAPREDEDEDDQTAAASEVSGT